ncbi:MAG: hypothetical protein IPO22_18250 [Anaerolineales bacterium]|nr:hypothetical protein [Anaerolineales bacterium]
MLTPEALLCPNNSSASSVPRRHEMLQKRVERQKAFDNTAPCRFSSKRLRPIRAGDWRGRLVQMTCKTAASEITGPPERKMAINALNSGAKNFHSETLKTQCAILGKPHRGAS